MRILGILFIAVGVLMTIALFVGGHSLVMLLGPMLVVLGIAMLVGSAAPRATLITGLVMLLIGGFPWIYTPWLMGARRGGEGPGMLGTMIFIFVGLPGLIATVVGFLYWLKD